MLAVAVARGHGVDWGAIDDALSNFSAPPMRWQIIRVGAVEFVNDAYNANPMSMRAAINAFRTMTVRGRRWLVLGGMLELGRISAREHHELGRLLGEMAWGGIITVGELGQMIGEGAIAAGYNQKRLYSVETAAAAADILAEKCGAGDAVLLKASRGIHLEGVLENYNLRVRASA